MPDASILNEKSHEEKWCSNSFPIPLFKWMSISIVVGVGREKKGPLHLVREQFERIAFFPSFYCDFWWQSDHHTSLQFEIKSWMKNDGKWFAQMSPIVCNVATLQLVFRGRVPFRRTHMRPIRQLSTRQRYLTWRFFATVTADYPSHRIKFGRLFDYSLLRSVVNCVERSRPKVVGRCAIFLGRRMNEKCQTLAVKGKKWWNGSRTTRTKLNEKKSVVNDVLITVVSLSNFRRSHTQWIVWTKVLKHSPANTESNGQTNGQGSMEKTMTSAVVVGGDCGWAADAKWLHAATVEV